MRATDATIWQCWRCLLCGYDMLDRNSVFVHFRDEHGCDIAQTRQVAMEVGAGGIVYEYAFPRGQSVLWLIEGQRKGKQ